jgi:simple sugar transport system ATP-binding protein
MRMGEVVASCTPKEETPLSMAEMMMGANLVSPERIIGKGEAKPQLVVRNLNAKSPHQYGVNLKGISFEVRSNEVLGIAGIAGNGQRELMEVLSGEVTANNENAILIGGAAHGLSGPIERRKAGVGLVPEERLGHGAVPELSLWENAFLSAAVPMKLLNKGFISVSASSAYADRIVQDFNVKTVGVSNAANSLSGGNLQKFIFGREILQSPRVMIALQPTWGVDAGSAAAIRQALIDLASKGAAVLVISQDLEELFEVSDRIAVVCGGELSEIYSTSTITVDQIGLLMSGINKGEEKVGSDIYAN